MSRTPGTHAHLTLTQADTGAAEDLRSLKRLAVVDLDFLAVMLHLDEIDTTTGELHKAYTERDLKAWKRRLIKVLKDSPSKERKFLRWKVYYEGRRHGAFSPRDIQVVGEEGELEVLPERSL